MMDHHYNWLKEDNAICSPKKILFCKRLQEFPLRKFQNLDFSFLQKILGLIPPKNLFDFWPSVYCNFSLGLQISILERSVRKYKYIVTLVFSRVKDISFRNCGPFHLLIIPFPNR